MALLLKKLMWPFFPQRIYVALFFEEIHVALLLKKSMWPFVLSAQNLTFENFEAFAEHVLNKFNEKDIPNLSFILSLILVLPFSSADAERAFSAMNLIKSKNRNKLLETLKSLMTIYTSGTEERKQIHDDMDDLAKIVATQVWSKGRSCMSKRYIEAYYGAY